MHKGLQGHEEHSAKLGHICTCIRKREVYRTLRKITITVLEG